MAEDRGRQKPPTFAGTLELKHVAERLGGDGLWDRREQARLDDLECRQVGPVGLIERCEQQDGETFEAYVKQETAKRSRDRKPAPSDTTSTAAERLIRELEAGSVDEQAIRL